MSTVFPGSFISLVLIFRPQKYREVKIFKRYRRLINDMYIVVIQKGQVLRGTGNS